MKFNELLVKYNRTFAYLLIIGIAVIFYLLNVFTPLLNDDYTYAFIFGSYNRISSVADVFVSQYLHWFMWGGRSIAHVFAQSFILIGKPFFDVLNTIVYIFFSLLIYYHASGSFKFYKNLVLYSLIHIALWYTLPAWGENLLWLTGSCNYLWTSTIVLAFLVPYRNSLVDGVKRKDSVLYVILMSLGGLLAGWSNENTSIVVFLFLLAYVVFFYIKKRKFAIWEIMGISFFLIGLLLLFIAPGNYIRAAAEPKIPMTIIDRFILCANGYYDSAAIILIAYLLFIFIFREQLKFTKLYFSIGAMSISLAACFVFIAAPISHFPSRTAITIVFFALIGLINLLTLIDFNVNAILKKTYVVLIGILMLCFFLPDLYYVVTRNYGQYKRFKKRTEYIVSEKIKGNLDVVVKYPIPYRSKVGAHSTVLGDPLNVPIVNKAMCEFFGVNSITGSEKGSDW